MLDLNSKLLLNVSNIAINAGAIIMEHYLVDTKVMIKEDKSPLTNADLGANKYIIKELRLLDKTIPILSEESLVHWSERKKWDNYWLVDPLDGTKEFINQNNEFTVNITLISNHNPILGVIYLPALSTLYYAYKNNGSYKLFIEKNSVSLSQSIKIQTIVKKKEDYQRVLVSRSHSNNALQIWLNKNFKNYELIKKGSSIKFCEIAEGKADLYLRFGPTSEWDIAAGHIILTESGGIMKSIENKKIFYNIKESVINPNFIASCRYEN